MNRNTCLKCGSTEVAAEVPLPDYFDFGMSGNQKVVVAETPENLIFKNWREFMIRGNICGSCGFIEHYIKKPAEFYRAYQKLKSDGME